MSDCGESASGESETLGLGQERGQNNTNRKGRRHDQQKNFS